MDGNAMLPENVSRSTMLPLSALARSLASLGIQRTYRTVWEWTEHGMSGRNGEKFKMPYRLIGGTRHSSISMYEETVELANAE